MATASWTASAHDGGSPVTAYTLHMLTSAGAHLTVDAGTSTTAALSDAMTTAAGTLWVTATNAFGVSQIGAETAYVPPAPPVDVPDPVAGALVLGFTTEAYDTSSGYDAGDGTKEVWFQFSVNDDGEYDLTVAPSSAGTATTTLWYWSGDDVPTRTNLIQVATLPASGGSVHLIAGLGYWVSIAGTNQTGALTFNPHVDSPVDTGPTIYGAPARDADGTTTTSGYLNNPADQQFHTDDAITISAISFFSNYDATGVDVQVSVRNFAGDTAFSTTTKHLTGDGSDYQLFTIALDTPYALPANSDFDIHIAATGAGPMCFWYNNAQGTLTAYDVAPAGGPLTWPNAPYSNGSQVASYKRMGVRLTLSDSSNVSYADGIFGAVLDSTGATTGAITSSTSANYNNAVQGFVALTDLHLTGATARFATPTGGSGTLRFAVLNASDPDAATVLGTGDATITFDGSQQWASCTFAAPVALTAGTPFWVRVFANGFSGGVTFYGSAGGVSPDVLPKPAPVSWPDAQAYRGYPATRLDGQYRILMALNVDVD